MAFSGVGEQRSRSNFILKRWKVIEDTREYDGRVWR